MLAFPNGGWDEGTRERGSWERGKKQNSRQCFISRGGSTRPRWHSPIRFTLHDPTLQALLSFPPLPRGSISVALTKYLIWAIVKGLQTLASILPTSFAHESRLRSIFMQCVVENLMSSHKALASQPWKSWKLSQHANLALLGNGLVDQRHKSLVVLVVQHCPTS